MNYLIALALLLGCSESHNEWEVSADTTSAGTADHQADPEDSHEEEDSGLACEDCTYLRYKLKIIFSNYPSDADAYVDVCIPKGELENCELEGAHICFKEKVSEDTVQFPPTSPPQKAEAYKNGYTNESFFDIDGAQLYTITYNVPDKKAPDKLGWQTVVLCTQTRGITEIFTGSLNPIAIASYEVGDRKTTNVVAASFN